MRIPIASPRRAAIFAVVALITVFVTTPGPRAARSDETKKAEVKKAERVECVLVALNETYQLQTKSQKPYLSCLVEDREAMDVAPDPTDATKMLLSPKKEGVVQLSIGMPGGAKEQVTVVVLKKLKD